MLRIRSVARLSRNLIDSVLSSRAVARVPKWLDQATCDQAAGALASSRYLSSYEDVDPPIGKQGITLFEAEQNRSIEEYFANAPDASKQRKETFQTLGFDPATRILDYIGDIWSEKVSVAERPDGRAYFYGLCRIIPGGTLIHTDWARYESPDLVVGELVAQAAVNLYLSMPRNGGSITVFDRHWRPADLGDRLEYGFNHDLVAGHDFVGTTPAAGDLLLFPSNNMHQVSPVGDEGGARMTLSFFLGMKENRQLIAWS